MLKDELEKSRNFSVAILIIALLTVYGGTTLPIGEGVWFNYNIEFKGTDNGEPEFESETAFLIDEIKSEDKIKEAYADNSQSSDADLEYSDVGFKEREDVMEFTKNLAILTIIIAGVLLAFMFGFMNGQFGENKVQEYLDYSKKMCLGLIIICFFNAGNFALNYTEAWQEDTSLSLEVICGTEEGDEIPKLVMFLGKCNNNNTDQIISGITGDVEASWHPGLAWFFTLLLIPSLAYIQFHRLNTLEDAGAFSAYKSAPKKKRRVSKRQRSNVTSETQIANSEVQQATLASARQESSEPPKVVKKKKPLKFKAKAEEVDIECPSCSEIMKIPKLNKLQDVKCKACGLSGEIEV